MTYGADLEDRVMELRDARLTYSQIGARTGLSRDQVAGIVRRCLRPPERRGHPSLPKSRRVVRGHHPLIRWLDEEIELQSQFADDVMLKAGLAPSTLKMWRKGKVPNLANFDAVMNVLGYRLHPVSLFEGEEE